MKESSIERVVGNLPVETKEKTLLDMADRFLQQNFPELRGKEKQKSPEETHIIECADNATNEILREYGLESFPVPLSNVHIIREEAWPWKTKGEYQPFVQAVLLREEANRIAQMDRTMHELFHFKSYTAIQKPIADTDSKSYKIYRLGFIASSRDGKKIYFTNLNEAITEELVKRRLAKFLTDPIFAEEVARNKEIAHYFKNSRLPNGELLFTDDTLFAEAIGRDRKGALVTKLSLDPEINWGVGRKTFGYVDERKIFNKLIDKIFEPNQGKYNSREQVFDLFAKAMLSGNLLPVGKLIDRTFGVGTFRAMAELDSELDKLEVFIENLTTASLA